MYPIDYQTLKVEQRERIERVQRENPGLTVRRRRRPVRRWRWQLWRRPEPLRLPGRLTLATDS
ncbi:MAG: hypothetical protein OEV40_31930 [Acidimicrobiia bacterium]|nr:hypothetical protein [Acidimicrobiia bacterium]